MNFSDPTNAAEKIDFVRVVADSVIKNNTVPADNVLGVLRERINNSTWEQLSRDKQFYTDIKNDVEIKNLRILGAERLAYHLCHVLFLDVRDGRVCVATETSSVAAVIVGKELYDILVALVAGENPFVRFTESQVWFYVSGQLFWKGQWDQPAVGKGEHRQSLEVGDYDVNDEILTFFDVFKF